MARTASSKQDKQNIEDGFDVTCVIGRVSVSKDGEDSIHLAAFRLIAEHDAPGEYVFPNLWGTETRVVIPVPVTPDECPHCHSAAGTNQFDECENCGRAVVQS